MAKKGNNHNNTKKNNAKNDAPKENRMYKKRFENFSDGVNEMRTISSIFNELVESFYYDVIDNDGKIEEFSPDDLAMCFYDYIRDNKFPSIHLKDTRFWSISVAANKLYIKTGYKITFGWQFKYKRDQSSGEYVADTYDFVISDIGNDDEIKNIALDLGWELDVK